LKTYLEIMNKGNDRTRLVLEQLLSLLYKEQAQEAPAANLSDLKDQSYLMGQDNQLLGKLSPGNDNDSILNKHGPYGSPYSLTSIFNRHSPYGSQYGAFSVNNPNCSTPPRLFIQGKMTGHVTVNHRLHHQIPTKTFFFLLEYEPELLLNNELSDDPTDLPAIVGDSYLLADDGQYLGKLTRNRNDSESVLNKTGPYGNPYSPTSIFNKFSEYGNGFSRLSPFNPYSKTPPRIFIDGELYGYLTENRITPIGRKISPRRLKEWVSGRF